MDMLPRPQRGRDVRKPTLILSLCHASYVRRHAIHTLSGLDLPRSLYDFFKDLAKENKLTQVLTRLGITDNVSQLVDSLLDKDRDLQCTPLSDYEMSTLADTLKSQKRPRSEFMNVHLEQNQSPVMLWNDTTR